MDGIAAAGKVFSFKNPVYTRSFPDPFVFKHKGKYYGIATGYAADGGVFPMATSDDLVEWSDLPAGAMRPLESSPPFYWAPEITYDNGRFYLYYSSGNETLMEIRVAVSVRPDGGYVDSGHVLTVQDFAIDPHIFIDNKGERYLFYATDFLDHSHIGTGTVVERMNGWFETDGPPAPVTRAKFDWQVYDPRRKEKGDVRWHTVEGPTVLERKGKYFETFSGGNWQNTTYGVSFAVSDDIVSDQEWQQFSDGENVLPILRTIPDIVIGPGHNSIVRGPNNRELYCVYHRWAGDERVMSIDRLDFAGERIFVVGATYTPQIAPFRASIYDLSPNANVADNAASGGRWLTSGDAIVGSISDLCERVYATPTSFLCEFWLRCAEWSGERSAFGFRLGGAGGSVIEFVINPARRSGRVTDRANSEPAQTDFLLPLDFALPADHLVRVEVNAGRLSVVLGNNAYRITTDLRFTVSSLSLFSNRSAAEFSAFELTAGFEDLFEFSEGDATCAHGWHCSTSATQLECIKRPGAMKLSAATDEFLAVKTFFAERGEFAGNFKLNDTGESPAFGLCLIDESESILTKYFADRTGLALKVGSTPEIRVDEFTIADFENFRQLRLIKLDGELILMLDHLEVLRTAIELPRACIGIFCTNCSIEVEMARVTAI